MTGGDTLFPKLELAVQNKKGQVMIFDNCDSDGNFYPDSLHCGTAVEQGEKWLLSCWFRQFALPVSR
jgi:prolyl 4-hydroxylase